MVNTLSIEFYLTEKYSVEGPMMVINDRNMQLFLNEMQLYSTVQ